MALLAAARLAGTPLPATAPLTAEGDLSAQMVAGIGRFLEKQTTAAESSRAQFWHPDFSSPVAYTASLEPNRQRFARMLGVIDARIATPAIEYVSTVSPSALVAETESFSVYAVRWPVFAGVYGEGLLLQPKGTVAARLIVLPDADQTPEMAIGLAGSDHDLARNVRRLAESGCQIIVPTLVDRSDAFSGNARLNVFTNQPHREWIYRQAFILGRHVIGYEIQKVLAAVDWMSRQPTDPSARIGVMGWGEGALLAFYSAALDPRIQTTLVSGYFGKRQELWREPIYRNVFGLLREFGDAEIAQLIVPRHLIVEPALPPVVLGPPAPRAGRNGAAPGRIALENASAVREEFERAKTLADVFKEYLHVASESGGAPWRDASVALLWKTLTRGDGALKPAGRELVEQRVGFDPIERQRRTVRELEDFTQGLLRIAGDTREAFFWQKLKPTTADAWRDATGGFRATFWNDVIGRFPAGQLPLNPRARVVVERPQWTAHEVVLDVLPDVFAWGYLLLPKDIKPGEKRPVVVTQHGLEGVPADVMDEDATTRANGFYHAFAARLAERGFIVFAPHNPYRGGNLFRQLQRQANPLGRSLFSIIIAQHEAVLDWLGTLPNVDAKRIGFYGLSYGGKTAMRVPAALERYALSICSGDFNEWIWKNGTTSWRPSYMFTREYEMPEFNLGTTFGYAEMAALIAPRPFMVERGHNDGVATDEWVAFEYAKVRRLYNRLQIPQRTEIEFFNGPHTINGQGTYQFLHRHLDWPDKKQN